MNLIRNLISKLIILLGLLFTYVLGFGDTMKQSPVQKDVSETIGSCNTDFFPSSVNMILKRDFAGWEIQKSSNLNSNVREIWQSVKPLKCPGTAIGKFSYTGTLLSYATLLVQADGRFKVVVFWRKEGKSAYEASVVESEENGASSVYIRGVPIRKFFDEVTKKKFDVRASEGILAVHSAENMYEADIIFLTSKGYKEESVDY